MVNKNMRLMYAIRRTSEMDGLERRKKETASMADKLTRPMMTHKTLGTNGTAQAMPIAQTARNAKVNPVARIASTKTLLTPRAGELPFLMLSG